jgi:hypothetical protein
VKSPILPVGNLLVEGSEAGPGAPAVLAANRALSSKLHASAAPVDAIADRLKNFLRLTL